MFIRLIKNKNGKTYVQVVDKSSGAYKVIRSFGSGITAKQIEVLQATAKQFITLVTGQQQIDFAGEVITIKNVLQSITKHKLVGVELLLGKLFDEIGFNVIEDAIFRQLVLYRLVYPGSKLKTTEYLYRYQGIYWDENKVYRYLDKLYNVQKEIVQQISYEHTVKVLGNQPHIIFYDVTTLYFEIEQEDELRRTGFSKEGKHQNPQIVLGLLVSKNGYPLAYDVFDGKKFEGHTLLPIINNFKEKYKLTQLVIVADAGLLSNNNITLLQQQHYQFILGARIKNETKQLQQKILAESYTNGSSKVFTKKDSTRLIVSYSTSRATKDAINRERGLKRLEKQIKQGKFTKSSINNKGYNKYLRLDGSINISIDYEKYKADNKWDGLKGYMTNSELSKDEVIENYSQLWQIEKAFRISKTDLKIRPIYHRLPKRIEAHICLSFIAYKLYKELERQLKEKKVAISPQKAIEIAQSIYEVAVISNESKEEVKQLLLLTNEQTYLAAIFNFGC